MTEPSRVFDRKSVRQHRERAAAAGGDDFLHREVTARLMERLDEVKRGFATALDLGCHRGSMTTRLAARSDIGSLVATDLSHGLAGHAARAGAAAIVADEEALPFAPASFDMIASCLTLHWINDLPGALIQARRALRPDGLFLAALLGGGTLQELRQSMIEAELEVEGGAGPRVSPFTDVREAGALLQRAGFALPVIDRDRITATYQDAFSLMSDLRAMAETNAVAGRRAGFSRRETLMRAAALYQERFARDDGRLPATFEIIYLTAWAPAATQPKPLAPGSARGRLADALGTDEIETGDPAPVPKRPVPRRGE